MKIIVPHDSLQPETMREVMEEFVTRDGAVHGHTETPLPQRVESVRRQLRSGKAVIVFDPETDSCNICPIEDVRIPQTDGDDADAVDGTIDSKQP